ncbi:MAG: hypothetical protein QOH71_1066 [Blastocatellia bacterium]|nr:hypothetical protein [Blastocatellia bacterium]
MRMTRANFRKLTGFMFILTPAWLFVNSRVLGAVSGFPDIQFAGVDTLLTRVHASGTLGVIVWYIYIIPGIFYIASTVMLHKVLEPERIPWFGVATTMGVVAWAIQFFGLVRWIFVYPYLANVWVGTNDPRTKETVTIIFNTINNYAGFALGQTIGIHLTALWLLLVGIAIKKSPLFKPWMGYVAILAGIGISIGNLGALGSVVPAINIRTFFSVAGIFWYISFTWMFILGFVMMASRADVYDELVPPDTL